MKLSTSNKDIKVEDVERKVASFKRLLLVMEELRALCPWDRKQTNESLRNLTIEETYELADAIDNQDSKNLKEELGDILLHMVFYSKIGEEQGEYDIGTVMDDLCDKLVRRHPHIYGDVDAQDEAAVKVNWEKIKQKEKKGKDRSVLDGVPKALPAMIKAYRMQDKTAQVGFEWRETEEVWEKVEEELAELRQEVEKESAPEKLKDEMGDVFFSLVNYARFIGVDPETALASTNKKFYKRFRFIEQSADKPLDQMTLEEMDALWNKAKTEPEDKL